MPTTVLRLQGKSVPTLRDEGTNRKTVTARKRTASVKEDCHLLLDSFGDQLQAVLDCHVTVPLLAMVPLHLAAVSLQLKERALMHRPQPSAPICPQRPAGDLQPRGAALLVRQKVSRCLLCDVRSGPLLVLHLVVLYPLRRAEPRTQEERTAPRPWHDATGSSLQQDCGPNQIWPSSHRRLVQTMCVHCCYPTCEH